MSKINSIKNHHAVLSVNNENGDLIVTLKPNLVKKSIPIKPNRFRTTKEKIQFVNSQIDNFKSLIENTPTPVDNIKFLSFATLKEINDNLDRFTTVDNFINHNKSVIAELQLQINDLQKELQKEELQDSFHDQTEIPPSLQNVIFQKHRANYYCPLTETSPHNIVNFTKSVNQWKQEQITNLTRIITKATNDLNTLNSIDTEIAQTELDNLITNLKEKYNITWHFVFSKIFFSQSHNP